MEDISMENQDVMITIVSKSFDELLSRFSTASSTSDVMASVTGQSSSNLADENQTTKDHSQLSRPSQRGINAVEFNSASPKDPSLSPRKKTTPTSPSPSSDNGELQGLFCDDVAKSHHRQHIDSTITCSLDEIVKNNLNPTAWATDKTKMRNQNTSSQESLESLDEFDNDIGFDFWKI
jgi:hypothetical protein